MENMLRSAAKDNDKRVLHFCPWLCGEGDDPEEMENVLRSAAKDND